MEDELRAAATPDLPVPVSRQLSSGFWEQQIHPVNRAVGS